MAGKSIATTTTYSPSLTGQKKKKAPIITGADWVRPDGRSLHQCRPAFLRTGAVNSASGSAYAEFGNTKVIVSVFGPRESKKAMIYSDTGRLNCNVSYTTFSFPVRGQAPETKDISSMLHKALEGAIILKSFPKTTVDVFALVLESGGSDLPVITTCASLALADAGIMLYDIVTSVSVDKVLKHLYPFIIESTVTGNKLQLLRRIRLAIKILNLHRNKKEVSCFGKNILIDPVSEEESYQDGSLMITCMPSRNEVTQMTVTGEWSTSKINEAMQLCLDACSKLGKLTRSCLKETAGTPQD